jgi:anthranilate phosphoribosyltransferase
MEREQSVAAPVNGATKVHRRARFLERLQAVLAQQGISDAQIAAIVAALRPRRDGRSETDPIVQARRRRVRL